MPDKDREKESPYVSMYERRAAEIGTSAAQRSYSDELAELTRQREAARIQRQTVGSSYAEMYQRAQGQSLRSRMSGTTPGLTGGLAEQRRSEISGAEMRALGSISGQRESAMREVDYMDLMAPQRAFEFSQQQQMAERETQMFNLQMINSRQDILASKMSDEDKIEALINTGMSLEEARAQIEDAGRGFFDRLRSGDASPFTVGLGAAGASAGLYGVGVTASQMASVYGSQGAGLLLSKGGKTLTSKKAITSKWSSLGGAKKFATALKGTTLGKALAPKAGKMLALGLGVKLLPLLVIGGLGAFAYSQWAKNK